MVVPDVTVSVEDQPGIIATRGSSTFTTCSTTATVDAVHTDPAEGIEASPRDILHLALPSGWRFLRWEGSDHPAVGEGANVWPATDTPARPDRIDVPVPIRSGDSIAGFTLWLESIDQRVVGQLEITVRVSVGG